MNFLGVSEFYPATFFHYVGLEFFCPKIRWEFSMRVPGPQAREATTGSQNHRFSSFLPSRICIQKRWLSMEKTLKPLKPCCKKWIGGSILAHHLGWWECGKKRRQDSFMIATSWGHQPPPNPHTCGSGILKTAQVIRILRFVMALRTLVTQKKREKTGSDVLFGYM